MLGRSCLAALLTQTWGFPHGWGFPCVVHWLYILQQECLCSILNTELVCDRKSKPTLTRLFKKCGIGAPECTSVHSIDIVVMNKWMKCTTKPQPFACFDAMFTWSSSLPFMISVFNWAWCRLRILTTWRQWRWQHVQPLHVHAIQTPEQPSSYKANSKQSNINVTLSVNFKLICWCVNLHQKVWYKSEKPVRPWSGWHYTTRELVYGYI